jgi:hypothetical protein
MTRLKPIKGFKANQFKEEMQAFLQAELADLSDEEKLKRIREIAEHGSLSEWWHKMRAEQELRRAS